MLPSMLRIQLEAALQASIAAAQPASGGCISNAAHLVLSDGRDVFAKWGQSELLEAEQHALKEIAKTRTVRVPQVHAIGDGWLLAEWIEPGPITPHAWELLGRSLALLHRTQAQEFGWPSSNFIGSLPQANEWCADWPRFWREQRILPQLERARALRAEDRARIEKLLMKHELAAAGNEEGASLLHGDLWSGNVLGAAQGDPAVIDPSAYFGHREVDLAMARLFGGFSERFFEAYNAEWPLQPGFEERCSYYQLYYMLVHVNLFGASYISGAMSLARKLGF